MLKFYLSGTVRVIMFLVPSSMTQDSCRHVCTGNINRNSVVRERLKGYQRDALGLILYML